MKRKIIFLILIFLILGLFLPGVSASENITMELPIAEESDTSLDETPNDEGNFADLATTINDNDNSSVVLTRNYSMGENETHVEISRDNIVIDGQGHTIDAKKRGNVFGVSGTNITFKNITFINGLSVNGGAIGDFYGSNKYYTVIDCTFINNTATNCGGALYSNNNPIYVYNSTFINNRNNGNYGGGAIFSDRDIYVVGCSFYGNTIARSSGSAIRSNRGVISLSDSVFAQAQEGYNYIQAPSYKLSNAYLSFTDLKNLISKSNGEINLEYDYKYLPDFDNGGITVSKNLIINGNNHCIDADYNAIRIFTVSSNNVILKDITFKNSRLNSPGNAVLANNPTNITNCTFMDNWASGQFGAALNLKGDNSNVTFCTFTGNKATTGAAIVVNSNNNHITYSYFKGNSKDYGGNMNYGSDISITGGKSAYINYNMLIDPRPLRQGATSYFYNNWYGKNELPDSSAPGAIAIPNYLIASFDGSFLQKTDDGYEYVFNVTFTRSDTGEIVDFLTHNLVYTVYDDSGSHSFSSGRNLKLSNEFEISKMSVDLGSIVLTKDFGITDDVGTFTDLNNILLAVGDNAVVNLVRDYKYDPNVDKEFITVSKTVTINGNGHTIDADGNPVRIFSVSADNVVIRNLTLTKGNSINGGAVRWIGNNGVLEYVNFTSCKSPGWSGGTTGEAGGGISWTGNNGILNHCNFNDCSAQGGGGASIHWSGKSGIVNDTVISNSIMYNWPYSYGGNNGAFAICWTGTDGQLLNTKITNPKKTGYNGRQYAVDFVNGHCWVDNLIITGQVDGNSLYINNMPLEDQIGNINVNKDIYRLTPTITLNNGLFKVNSVKSGSVTYTIDGGSNKVASVDENGYFVLDFDSSSNHFIKVTYNKNMYYNEVVAYFNYDASCGNSVWYVNGSVESEGIGVITNPFKTLKKAFESVSEGDIICVAPGTYSSLENRDLTVSKSLTISRWGEDGEVVFDANGESKIFIFKSPVNLTSITFKNAVSDFGGAVTFSNDANISDCVFINNSARYGGAVCIDENANVLFSGCSFIHDISSLGGGAVYTWGGNLTFTDSIFEDCLSQYGGSLFSLEGALTLINTNFNNNSALGFGGGVYKRSGQLTIRNGNYTNNSAYYDGGAVYVSHAVENIGGTFFEKNIAGYGGGAIHSLAGTLLCSNINLKDNVSYAYNGCVDTKYFNQFIDLGDYPLIVANTSNFNGTLPSRFNLAENGWDTSVKNQGSLGICWDYSTIAMVETAVKKATGIELDLSENNLKNLISRYSEYGWNRDPNGGGGRWDGCTYLAASLGPILESIDPTSAYGFSPLINTIIHISNIPIVVRSRDDPLDNDHVKEVLMKYGSIKASMSTSGANGYNYYQNTTTATGHAVSIVGWDDNYSRNNFKNDCPGDGAWIVKNSWGPYSGDHGYIYISYYDVSFAWGNLYYVMFNETVKYDRVYQYDYLNYGWWGLSVSNTWYKNTYTSVKNETITAFSTFFSGKTNWEAFVYVNGELKHSQKGSSAAGGYFTFNFDKCIPVEKGDEFSIVLKLATGGFPYVNKDAITVPCGEGLSFYSTDGVNWNDLDKNNRVACLKVFTQNMPGSSVTINPIGEAVYNSEVTVEFNVENRTSVSYIVKNKEGKTVLSAHDIQANSILLNGLAAGNYTIVISNENTDRFTGSQISRNFTVNKASSSVVIDDIAPVRYSNPVEISFNVDNTTTATYTVKNDNGIAVVENAIISGNKISITNLAVGNYTISISNSENENYTGDVKSKRFTIEKSTNNVDVIIKNTVLPNAVEVKVNADIDGVYSVDIGGNKLEVNVADGVGVNTIKLPNTNGYITKTTFADVENYTLNINEASFNVTKGINNIRVSAESATYPDNVTIKLTADVGGEYKIVLSNGNEFTISANESKSIKLPVGSYVAAVEYASDDYEGNVTETSFEVKKAIPNISVSVPQKADVGQAVNVGVTVPADATGNVTVVVDREVYGSYVVGETINVRDLAKGNHSVVVKYSGDGNYESVQSEEYAVNVVLVDVSDKITFNGSAVVYGENATIDVTLPDDARGSVNVTVNGVRYSSNVVNGKAAIAVPGLNAGKYADLIVYYSGDSKYTDASGLVNITVKPADVSWDVQADNVIINAGENVTVAVTGAGEGTVVYILNGKKYGEYSLTDAVNGVCVTGFDAAGDYNITVGFKENSNYNYGDAKTIKVKVNHISTDIDVDVPQEVNVGQSAEITALLPADATGNVTFIVNGSEYETVSVKNGFAKTTISNLTLGNYSIVVKYSGDDNYGFAQSEEYIINVVLVDVSDKITFNGSAVVYGENATINVTLPSDARGSVNVTVNGIKYSSNVANGKAAITVPGLNVGKYTDLIVYYSGDSKYTDASGLINITVKPADVSWDVQADKVIINAGENVTVAVTCSGEGTVVYTLNGKKYDEYSLTDAVKGVCVTGFDIAGDYNITLGFKENSNYNYGDAKTIKVKVNHISTDIDVDVPQEVNVGQSAEITALLPADAAGEVTFIVNGKEYGTVSVKNGFAKVTISNLALGNYTASVKYSGDGKYENGSADASFKVTLVDEYDISVESNSNDGKVIIEVILPDDACGKIFINGYEANVENGKAVLTISDLPAGENNLTVSYSGDDKYASKTVNMVVNNTKRDAILYGDKVEVYVGEESNLTVVLKDSSGNPLSDKIINITIANMIYESKTNEKGEAIFEINLKSGVYGVSAVFAGDSKYNSAVLSTTVEVYSNVRIDQNRDFVKDYADSNKMFKVRALDMWGNPVGKGKVVKFTVSGKTYSVKTDDDGYASLDINLAPGEYTIVSEYGGYTVSNSITVCNVLSASDMQFKEGKSYYFAATLKGSDGKGISGKTISFTVKGKTYTAKTNSAGVAKITLPMTLHTGSYAVNVKYGQYSISKILKIVK